MSLSNPPEPLIVRLRPNMPYLGLLLMAVGGVVFGVSVPDVFGLFIVGGFGGLLVVFGGPVVLSTVCRVPVMVADDAGIRFPLMGVRLAWPDVASVKRSVGGRLRAGTRPVLLRPVLLVYPADAEATAREVRPWLRREVRSHLATYGTPIVVSGASLDRSLDEIDAAIRQRMSLG